ncbi:hypothetical protein GCM10010483_26050 [Actinokineospora diospyrosa]
MVLDSGLRVHGHAGSGRLRVARAAVATGPLGHLLGEREDDQAVPGPRCLTPVACLAAFGPGCLLVVLDSGLRVRAVPAPVACPAAFGPGYLLLALDSGAACLVVPDLDACLASA